MGKILSLAPKLATKKPSKETNFATSSEGEVRQLSDYSPRQQDRAKRFKIFYDHLLGMLEAAASVSEKTDLEKARLRKKLLREGLSLNKQSATFSADRVDVGEAVFISQLLDGPLEDFEMATALACALKEVVFRSFEGKRLTPDQRIEKQKKLTEYVVSILGKTQ
jgi:hypothetical protein